MLRCTICEREFEVEFIKNNLTGDFIYKPICYKCICLISDYKVNCQGEKHGIIPVLVRL